MSQCLNNIQLGPIPLLTACISTVHRIFSMFTVQIWNQKGALIPASKQLKHTPLLLIVC